MKTAETTPPKPVDGEFEVVAVQSGALEAITRGEIDIQIATAHKYPRNLTTFKEKALQMACFDQETAESCIYVRPVGKEKNPDTGKWEQKFAEGLSIRAAEIVGATYGNLRVGAMIIEQTPERVTARGFAHDLESNFAATSDHTEVTVKVDGTPYSARQSALLASVACSKSLRNATFRVVPRAMFKSIEIEIRKLINGDTKSFEQRRAAVVQWVQRLGIDAGRVWVTLGVEGPDDVTAEHLMTLTGLRTAIREKETTVDEAFPPITQTGNVGGEPKPKPNTKPKPEPPPAGTSTAAPPTGTAPTPTASEEAAGGQKPPATEPPPTDEKKDGKKPAAEKSGAPKPEELRKTLIGKISVHNIGKKRLMTQLKSTGMVPVDAEFDSLDVATLAHIDDGIEEIIQAILKPE